LGIEDMKMIEKIHLSIINELKVNSINFHGRDWFNSFLDAKTIKYLDDKVEKMLSMKIKNQ
jgi:hypothetical protein